MVAYAQSPAIAPELSSQDTHAAALGTSSMPTPLHRSSPPAGPRTC